MAMKVPLLDEQEFNQPEGLIALPEQDLNKHNNFMWYFYNSQFNEPSCNNTAVLNAHLGDARTYDVIHDRKEFDRLLHTIPGGLQFVVAGEPKAEGQPWLMQRQNGQRNAEDRIETLVEGNWYNQGTRILQGPSVLDVVRARLLTMSTRLQQIAELSQSMTHWSPATGYSYFPPSYDVPKAAETASRIGSPTLPPTELDPTDAVAAQAAEPAESTTDFSDALFMQSLLLTNRYGDEYMDENPLRGEPGQFVFTNTRNAVDERNKAQEQSSHTASQPAPLKADTRPPSLAPSVAPPPKAAATPTAPEAHSRKSSTVNLPRDKKRERRKSKGLATPTTPGAPPQL
ncbi:Mediator of RNA polymerase II transcription subunit 6 [Pleosporales sp. CAS-2024a]